MIPNTQHLPGISDNLSAGDLDAERFRARVGTAAARRLDPVPAEWQHVFTPETWDAFERARFECWHSEGGILSPEGYLQR